MDSPESSLDLQATCCTCLHWRPESGAEQTHGWGQCRRSPPAMPPIEEDKLVHVGVWPHTREHDWCGEWRRIDPRETP